MNFIGRRILNVLKNDFVTANKVCVLRRNYSFKSPANPENIYPNSYPKLRTPDFVPENPSDKFSGFIPIEKLTISYSRSSGPGGQNVNKVNTKVDLRFKVQEATWLHDDIKPKLVDQQRNRINKDGELIIQSDLTRLQSLNLADAMAKLRSMIRKASEPEPTVTPETEEILRKRHLKASRERLYEKRAHSMIKQGRRMSDID